MGRSGASCTTGFTLTIEACRICLEKGWTSALEATLIGCLKDLESSTGKRLGDRERPLLVSVRSGAPVSMPGMMDTVLNVGITEDIARGLGEATGDPRFGWDTLRRLRSYVSVVLDAPAELIREVSDKHLGRDEGASMTPDELGQATIALRAAFADLNYPVPGDPLEQVRQAVGPYLRRGPASERKPIGVWRKFPTISSWLQTCR